MALDTSPRVAALQNQLYREVGPAGRARITVELSDMLRDLAAAGARHRHPDYDEEQVQSEVLAVFYGRELNER
jgi:hypothetical protein